MYASLYMFMNDVKSIIQISTTENLRALLEDFQKEVIEGMHIGGGFLGMEKRNQIRFRFSF